MKTAHIYLIGAGGVGSWLLPKLIKLGHKVTVFDGDRFEKKNMDRQLFDSEQLGMNKAEALATKYGCEFEPNYFSLGWVSPMKDDWIIVAADNNPARVAALQEADRSGCRVIIAANEYTDAEAYVYYPAWKGTKHDPRVYYPVLLTDRSGDPLQPEGCVEASENSPQLVLANGWAAGFADHLFYHHTTEEWSEWAPIRHRASIHKLFTIRYND